jgi:phosphoglycolate phosphatase-like HAD superfamily hydrolase
MENKLILWDIDGTLLFCGSDGTRALNKTFHDLYSIVNAFESSSIGGALDSVIIENIIRKFSILNPNKEEIIKVYVDNLKEILNNNSEKRILPGAHEIVSHVSNSKNVFNGILTSNLKEGAKVKLSSVGLEKFFWVGGYGDHLGEKWDSAEIAISQAEDFYKVKFDKQNIFVIGDSVYDINCAKKLGINCIAVATGWTAYYDLEKAMPTYIFKSLNNYKEVIEILFQ